MKVLVFHIGAQRYGLDLAGIRQVLPAAALRELPLAPPCVAGLLDLHGAPLPVIDLDRLAGIVPSPPHYDTRIVVVDHVLGDGSLRALGLLAARVQGVQQIAPGQLHDAGVRGAPFLGQVASNDGAMLQLVEVDQLLTPGVRDLLFPEGQA